MPLHHEIKNKGSVAHPTGGGEYLISEHHTIGEGATSVVKMAQHSCTKQTAVVKMVNLAMHSKYFDQELQALSMMNHKNIVKLYQYDVNYGFLFLEYIPFPSMYDFIQQCGRLSEELAFRIFYQIVDAFLHMHSLGISHQDFKPENLCYNPRTHEIKILDFGLSLVEEEPSTKYGYGSPLYMAPEVYEQNPYDRFKADIWSMGVSFYEILTGDTPFADCNNMDDLKNFLLFDQSPIQIPEYVSPSASFILKPMLNRDPEERISLPMIMTLIQQYLKTS
jgi:serine/threonine protein kinase